MLSWSIKSAVDLQKILECFDPDQQTEVLKAALNLLENRLTGDQEQKQRSPGSTDVRVLTDIIRMANAELQSIKDS